MIRPADMVRVRDVDNSEALVLEIVGKIAILEASRTGRRVNVPVDKLELIGRES